MAEITQNKRAIPQQPKNPDRRSASMPPPIETRSQTLKPGLYLVASPIGNLRDITFRALDTLSSADVVICEDTRVTGKLLNAYGFKKKLQVYNDHSTDGQREKIIEIINQGQSVAVLSDAGTPMVSDPGYKLVQYALQASIYVTAIPGPNAALPALQLSGLPSDNFSFLGFLPPKSVARQKVLHKWDTTPGTLIIYETGPRLADSLADMKKVLGDRQAAVMRELTKMYEEGRRGSLSDLIDYYTMNGPPKGEIVVTLGAALPELVSSDSIETQLKKALETMSVRDAAEVVAQATGKPKKTIYTLALKLGSSS